MFDPNAKNGDGDIYVQDGTKYQRLAKPKINVIGAMAGKANKPKNKKYEKIATGCGDCFESAAKTLSDLVLQNPQRSDDFRLVHGVPLGTGGEAKDLRFEHAWVEETTKRTDEQINKMLENIPENMRESMRESMGKMLSESVTVYDNSNGSNAVLPRDVYYSIGNIDNEANQRYSYQEMVKQQELTGHYGPYDQLVGGMRAGRLTQEPQKLPLRYPDDNGAIVKLTDIEKNGRLKAEEIFKTLGMRALDEDGQATLLGVPRSTLKKLKEKDASINGYVADKIAVMVFGIHPMDIWGDTWLDEQILNPQKNIKPPKPLTEKEQQVLDLKATGLSDVAIAKRLGVSKQRVLQLRKTGLSKMDQFSLIDDEKIDNLIKPETAKAIATSIFLDTGTSPTGLLGAMTNSNLEPDDPMFESPQERENREQAFADFIEERYIEVFRRDAIKNGLDVTENDFLDFINGLDPNDVAQDFESETGISSWGLEYDEEGGVQIAEWAEAGFNSYEEYEDWFDSPVSDIIKETGAGKAQGTLFNDQKWEDYRKSDDYIKYGGDEDLMNRNIEQHQKFSEWAAKKDWNNFHNSHFDWWAFPIDEVSNSYGQKFAVPQESLTKFRQDPDFLKRLDENLINTSKSYGWDLLEEKWFGDDVRDPNQVPQKLSQIRLYKMARSALVLGRCAHFRSLQKMYDNLTSFGWFKNQDEGFWSTNHPCTNSGTDVPNVSDKQPPKLTGSMAGSKKSVNSVASRAKRLASIRKKIEKELPKILRTSKTLSTFSGDKEHRAFLKTIGLSKKQIDLITGKNPISLNEFADGAVASGNCYEASADLGIFLIKRNFVKEGEVFVREVGPPLRTWVADKYDEDGEYILGGTHFVLQIGPVNSPKSLIIDLTLRQFDDSQDFPWIGTVAEYRKMGYIAPEYNKTPGGNDGLFEIGADTQKILSDGYIEESTWLKNYLKVLKRETLANPVEPIYPKTQYVPKKYKGYGLKKKKTPNSKLTGSMSNQESEIQEPMTKLKNKIIESLPKLLQKKFKTEIWEGEKDYDRLIEMGVDTETAQQVTTDGKLPLSVFGDAILAAGNCGPASETLGAELIRSGIIKSFEEIYIREVGLPGFGNRSDMGTHYALHIGSPTSKDALIVDLTLRQFDIEADFPWVGTVAEYQDMGYNSANNDDYVGWDNIGRRFIRFIRISGDADWQGPNQYVEMPEGYDGEKPLDFLEDE